MLSYINILIFVLHVNEWGFCKPSYMPRKYAQDVPGVDWKTTLRKKVKPPISQGFGHRKSYGQLNVLNALAYSLIPLIIQEQIIAQPRES